jgi:DNA polymerase (family 10)
MKLEEASVLAHDIVEAIKHLCDPQRVEVVGSIRRGRPEVHDVDIVLIPQQWMWHNIVHTLKHRLGAAVVESGPELVRLIIQEIQVDLYRATPKTWGVLLLIRTGSTQHNIKLCSHAKSMGLMLSAAHGVLKIEDGKVIASRTEEEIFSALGLAYVEPKNREV